MAVGIIVAASLFKAAVGLCFFQDQLVTMRQLPTRVLTARFEREYVRDAAVTAG